MNDLLSTQRLIIPTLVFKGGLVFISITTSTPYHDSHLGKTAQARTAFFRLSCGGQYRICTLLWASLWPQCPSWRRNSSMFRCLTSRPKRILMLPVCNQSGFDGRHRLGQTYLFTRVVCTYT